jgi:hypothetical protein
MRGLFELSVVGVFLFLIPICAYSADNDELAYQSAVDRVKAGDLSIDWRGLRFACLKAPSCQPRASKADLAVLNATSKLEDKLQLALKMIDQGFANIEAHADASGIYKALGKSTEADREYAIVLAFMRSIFDQHDGKSKETALEVITGREEYVVVSSRGFPYYGPRVKTSQFRDGPHRYSRWEIASADALHLTIIFFNEDAFIDAKSLPR